MSDDATHIEHLVDELLAEFGIVEAPAVEPVQPVKADRAERPRASWMDQVGRAKRAG